MKNRILKFLAGYMAALLLCMLIVFISIFYIKTISGPQNVLSEQVSTSRFPDMPLNDQFGRPKTAYDFTGKLVVADFWFAGCQPCLEEMKYFPALLKKYNGRLTILSFTPDSREFTKKLLETHSGVWSFLEANNPDWLFLNYDAKQKGNIQEQLILGGFPSYFLIDSKGTYIGSPGSAVYGIEKELSGVFLLNLTYQKFFENYTSHDLRAVFVLFNLLVVIFVAGKFFARIVIRRIRTRENLIPETKE